MAIQMLISRAQVKTNNQNGYFLYIQVKLLIQTNKNNIIAENKKTDIYRLV